MAEPNPYLVPSLWVDVKYADATIIMGQKTWKVHRAIICKQSPYFEKALGGHFIEAQNKTIILTGCEFLEEEVDGLLKYLYHHELDLKQKRQPIRTYVVADYFQVEELRDKAVEEASCGLLKLLKQKYFVNFRDWCHTVFTQFPDTQLEASFVKIIADNILVVMYESGAWDELTAAYPSMMKKLFPVLHPKPEPATGIKRPASVDNGGWWANYETTRERRRRLQQS